MAVCEVCGNNYDKPLEVQYDGKKHTFDSFECAIHALPPKCARCECRIIGHGVQVDRTMFCCAHCAEHSGQHGIKDRATTAPAR